MAFPALAAREIVGLALAEDRASEDVTTLAVIPKNLKAKAALISRQAGVAAGLPLLALVFGFLDKRVRTRLLVRDGSRIREGQSLAVLSGPARAILQGERTALNLLARLCGVATLTAAYVKIAGCRTRIYDTRKTTPGLRALERYAVRMGGGWNHRFDLASAILIKDNHIALAGDLAAAVLRARARNGGAPVEVEAGTLDEVRTAMAVGAETILLDNMSPPQAKRALRLIGSKAATEISGGITLSNLKSYVKLRPDRISIGALTHSAPALDLSLELG